jgi:hypothetical protein
MPSRQVHEMIDLLILGKKYPKVHKTLDLPHKWLGSRHRVLFHDEVTAMLIGYMISGNEGMLSALLHVWLDRVKK